MFTKKLLVLAGGQAALVLGLCSALPSIAAGAEGSTPQESGTLAEVVVTAQKRSENLQDVPIAVTALSIGQLAGSSIDGQLTLPKVTPNLNFTVVSTFASAYIRGVGTQFANPGLESSVSVYLDDVYVPRASAGMFTFNDIQRIEVLKGPQGTLYGRNATGGAIRIVTGDPSKEVEGSASVTAGTNSRVALDGMINIPINEYASFRLSGRHDQNDGYMRNISPNAGSPFVPKRLQDRDESLFLAKLLIKPNDQWTIKLTGDYEKKNDSEGNAFQNLFTTVPEQIGIAFGGIGHTSFYDIANDNDVYNNIYAYGLTARIDYDFGAATISSISAKRKEYERNCADLDGTSANFQWSCGKPRTRQFTQEFQITSNGSGKLRYVAGIYYLHERSAYPFSIQGAAIDGGFGPLVGLLNLGLASPLVFQSSDEGIKVESTAPYAQLDYQLNDQWSMTAGVRYTWEKKTLLGNSGGLATGLADGFPVPGTFIPGPLGPCAAPGQVLCTAAPDSIKFNKFTPKLTLSYKPSSDHLLYLTASKGFKSGGYNLPSFGAVDSVKPETLTDIEFGWKYEAGSIRFNSSAFGYDYKDLQIQITDQTTGGTRVKNAAAARLYGVEGDLTWLATSNFELGAGAGYLKTKYKDFRGDAYVACSKVSSLPQPDQIAINGVNAGLAACADNRNLGLALVGGQDLSGNKMVNAPEFSGYLRGTYTLPLANSSKLHLSSVINYRSKSYFDVANLFLDDSRLLVSARVQWDSPSEKFAFTVYGENLTGKEYFYSRPAQATGGWQTPAPPRQVYIQASAKF